MKLIDVIRRLCLESENDPYKKELVIQNILFQNSFRPGDIFKTKLRIVRGAVKRALVPVPGVSRVITCDCFITRGGAETPLNQVSGGDLSQAGARGAEIRQAPSGPGHSGLSELRQHP